MANTTFQRGEGDTDAASNTSYYPSCDNWINFHYCPLV